jgi:hypothetical protein
MQAGVPARTDTMPVRSTTSWLMLTNAWADRFWMQTPAGRLFPGVRVRSSSGLTRTRLTGMCFMPLTDFDLTSSAQDHEQEIEQFLALGHAGSTQCTGSHRCTLSAADECILA